MTVPMNLLQKGGGEHVSKCEAIGNFMQTYCVSQIGPRMLICVGCAKRPTLYLI